ncbi:MAG TPA: diguanylate cyclase [Solirubrobacteraceae bacterium]|nr:diguanylate cyclase [Solirubrobacteraceae bacterium]
MRARQQREDLERQLADAQRQIADLERRLGLQAGNDPVTGLLNLGRFRAQLDVEVKRTRRHGRPLCAAVLDLDGFRAVNIQHGYAVGDELLTAAGRALGAGLRAHDLACRTGADEFAILLPETDLGGAEAGMQRVLAELENTSVGPLESIRASIGVAQFDRAHTAAQLLAAAAQGLERARTEGGGRVGVATDDAGAPADTHRRDAVAALAVALLERDRYTGEHSQYVVDLSGAVAHGLGVDEAVVAEVQAAALLHDIGKVAVPDDILNKPGALTEEQWRQMRDHTLIGERILRAIPGLGNVARVVRHEHERWDGGGYPDGLAGEDIPVGSRIILACDAYHAMTSDRPYRKAMSHGEAIAELSANAGTQFDPRVVEVLIGQLYGQRQAAAAVSAASQA